MTKPTTCHPLKVSSGGQMTDLSAAEGNLPFKHSFQVKNIIFKKVSIWLIMLSGFFISEVAFNATSPHAHTIIGLQQKIDVYTVCSDEQSFKLHIPTNIQFN